MTAPHLTVETDGSHAGTAWRAASRYVPMAITAMYGVKKSAASRATAFARRRNDASVMAPRSAISCRWNGWSFDSTCIYLLLFALTSCVCGLDGHGTCTSACRVRGILPRLCHQTGAHWAT